MEVLMENVDQVGASKDTFGNSHGQDRVVSEAISFTEEGEVLGLGSRSFVNRTNNVSSNGTYHGPPPTAICLSHANTLSPEPFSLGAKTLVPGNIS